MSTTYMVALDYDQFASFEAVAVEPACPDGIQPGRVITGADFVSIDDGHYKSSWVYSALSFTQYIELITQFDLLSSRSRKVCILTRDTDSITGDFTKWNGTIVKPTPKLTPTKGLYENVIFELVGLRKVAGDFNSTDWNDDWNW